MHKSLFRRRRAALGSLLFGGALTASVLVGAFPASASSVIRPIPVGPSPPLGVSSDGTHVWVANAGSNTVTELNASTGAVIRKITVGYVPSGASSDGTHVWVANVSDNTVSELNASTGAVIQTIPVGGGPEFVVSSDGIQVWVTNFYANTVTEISPPSGPQGNIFATRFISCNTLHVGYNRFVNGTLVHWKPRYLLVLP
jgi:YVTN family beta-propeller protein